MNYNILTKFEHPFSGYWHFPCVMGWKRVQFMLGNLQSFLHCWFYSFVLILIDLIVFFCSHLLLSMIQTHTMFLGQERKPTDSTQEGCVPELVVACFFQDIKMLSSASILKLLVRKKS